MDFIIGHDLQKFGYTLDEFREEYISITDIIDDTEAEIIKDDPSHLIAFKENQEILGWAIWHESSTTEHREGSPRDKEDRKILEKLVRKE